MGAHVIGIKDMAGLCQPRAAGVLVKALKEEIGLPIHFHTHDTSGIAAASVLAAIEAGADAVDGAIDALSGLTSQPNLGSIVESLRFGPRDTGIDTEQAAGRSPAIGSRCATATSRSRATSARAPPRSMCTACRAASTRIYGNRPARSASTIIAGRRLRAAYAEVNQMFGDIIKVTPTSKVVGDMAIMMVSSGLTRAAVLDPATEIAFPESVVQLFHGDLGLPLGGFPPDLQAKVLGEKKALTVRPGELLPPADLAAERAAAEKKVGRTISDAELASYLMYPKVFVDYAADRATFGEMSSLPTSVFFFGMQSGQEINIDLERGKTLIVRYVTTSDAHEDGTRTVFFELNGQPRPIRVADRSQVAKKPAQRKAEAGNAAHIGAPMPGTVVTVPVHAGQIHPPRRRAPLARSDEDGNHGARRARRRAQGGPRTPRPAGRHEGSADRVRGLARAARFSVASVEK